MKISFKDADPHSLANLIQAEWVCPTQYVFSDSNIRHIHTESWLQAGFDDSHCKWSNIFSKCEIFLEMNWSHFPQQFSSIFACAHTHTEFVLSFLPYWTFASFVSLISFTFYTPLNTSKCICKGVVFIFYPQWIFIWKSLVVQLKLCAWLNGWDTDLGSAVAHNLVYTSVNDVLKTWSSFQQ